jgi:tellurite resistance protein
MKNTNAWPLVGSNAPSWAHVRDASGSKGKLGRGREFYANTFIATHTLMRMKLSSATPPPPPNSATVVPIGTGRHWLARLPPGLFAVVFGLLGLAGAWRRLQGFDVIYADAIATALLYVGTALLELLLLFWLIKFVRFRDDAQKDFAHPVNGAMLSLLPLTMLLSVALWLPLFPQYFQIAASIAIAALALQAVIAWRAVSRVATGDMPADMVTPALYLPPVGGGLIGALAVNALGLHGFAVLLFGMGLSAWALLELRVVNRLFAGPLPPPLRPTLGVEIAPAPVATLVAATLWPALPADVLLIGIGISCGPLIAVLARWRWWTSVPFSAGFWSFSFPLAAFASVIVEAVRRGGWPIEVGYVAVLVASAVIGYLAVRTVALLVRGKLLPPG